MKPAAGGRAKQAVAKRRALQNRNLGPLYSGAMTFWFTLFFLVPVIIIISYSFLKRGTYGGVEMEFSLDAYRSLSDSVFLGITLRTLYISVITTIITILIALPCGYYMARSRRQDILLLLIIIPFWTNFLIRVFAWMNILASDGFVNATVLPVWNGFISAIFSGLSGIFGGSSFFSETLPQLLLIDTPVQFLYNQGAVVLVLVYMYMPYAILPLFASIDKFDFSLLEAARDLGASKMSAMVRILLPNIRGGILTAVLFTFIPIFGAYAVPLLVGGRDSYMLGNMIADQLLRARNWPRAAAISMVITVVTTVGVMFTMVVKKKDASGASRTKGAREGEAS